MGRKESNQTNKHVSEMVAELWQTLHHAFNVHLREIIQIGSEGE